MHYPYSLSYLDSLNAALCGGALLLTALILFGRMNGIARAALLASVWLAAVSLSVGPTLGTFGVKPTPQALRTALVLSSGLATMGVIFCGRPVLSLLALLGQLPLWFVIGFVKDSDGELAALHLAWVGLLVGLVTRSACPRTVEPAAVEGERSYALHDAVVFAVAAALTALVCLGVMHKHEGAADEWGYTYQAAVFAKGHVYAHAPRCEHYLESFYVFESEGRLFSQYTPGWPLFIMPFVWVRAVWLSGPFALGLMAWGLARLGRSAARGFGRRDAPPSPRVVRAAGTWAAIVAMFGTTILINGASRFSHVYTVALYAWTLEALVQVTTPDLPRRRQVLWGIVLGTAAVHMLASRPADGAFMGVGVTLLFLYALVRRRVGWRALVATAAAFALWSLFMLVILRLQLGKWFTTGYALNSVIRPWNIVKYSKPQPNEWRYGFPLATGAYCWWPCSLAFGLAGLAQLRGRALGLVLAIAVSCLPFLVYNSYLDLGQRGPFDWGYGPRYAMDLVVPMAIGTGAALAPMASSAFGRAFDGRSALVRGGPLALAVFAIASAWLRIVTLAWPTDYEHTRRHSSLDRAIEEAHLKNALVVGLKGVTGFSDMDVTRNLPIDLYPNQNVLIAIDRDSPKEAEACLHDAFPTRALYTASGVDDVKITPVPVP